LEKSKSINYGKQNIDDSDIESVINVLKSEYLTQGPKVKEFEESIARYCDVEYCKVVSSGTAALHLAYLAVGLTSGDIVWTASNTFVATANMALACGAKVEFIDIDIDTYNLSINHLKSKLLKARRENSLPKVVVPVHFAGKSCDMEEIWNLSKEYGFTVIEDGSHALGGSYKEHKIGCCEFSHICTFSFHPVKMITTGEGGAITTNNKDFDELINELRSHGITRDRKKFSRDNKADWYYEQLSLGFNFRMTDFQAALGLSQMKRLDSFIDKRQIIARRYSNELKKVTTPLKDDFCSSWHLYVILCNRRDELYNFLKKNGVNTQVHYIPVESQPFFNQPILENSKKYSENCLSLPIYFDLSFDDQSKVIALINKFL